MTEFDEKVSQIKKAQGESPFQTKSRDSFCLQTHGSIYPRLERSCHR